MYSTTPTWKQKTLRERTGALGIEDKDISSDLEWLEIMVENR